MSFPDIEALLVGWLQGQFPAARVVTETPADLTGNLPLVKVRRTSGDDDNVRLDRPVVDLDVFDTDVQAASALSAQIRDALLYTLPYAMPVGGTVTGVYTVVGPRWLPYDDTSVRRYQASYRLFAHT